MAEQTVVYVEWRDGWWQTSDDAPTSRQITAKRWDDMLEAVERDLDTRDVLVKAHPPKESAKVIPELDKANEELEQAVRRRWLARLRFEAGFRAAGIPAVDAAKILGMNPRTLRNHWYELARLDRETEG